MLKSDIKHFENLASTDESTRVAAAVHLQQLKFRHFDDHPVGTFRFSSDQLSSLLSAWDTTPNDLLKAWLAQALALTNTYTPEARKVLVDALHLDGPYMPEVAAGVIGCRAHITDSNEIVKSLHRHINPMVRWHCAKAMRSMVFHQEFDYASDMPILRTLMLDPESSVRHEAVMAAMDIPELTAVDYEVLLDVVNLYGGSARHYASLLITKLEGSVPGCTRSAFAAREPMLRTDGIYITERAELDADGVWVSSGCLRFFPDSTVNYFGTNIAPVHLSKRLPGLAPSTSAGVVTRTGVNISFSVTGRPCAADYAGHIDGHELHLTCTHRDTGRSSSEKYRFIYADWNATPAIETSIPPHKSGAKKKAPQSFIPAPPQSMRASDAAKWYVQMLARLPGMLESARNDSERVTLGWSVKSEMRDAAVRAMYDPTLKKEFFAKIPLPSLEELRAQEPSTALKLLVTVTQSEVRAFPGTIGEMIGLQYWDGKHHWVMTEEGWAPKP
ncbi:MAG: hypothetical protein V4858_09250 [Pseudomonadota bacterium]